MPSSVRGAEQMARLLDELPKRLQGVPLRTAVLAGAEEIRQRVQEKAPIGTERPKKASATLSRSIIKRIVRGPRGVVRAAISARAPHAHLVEFGTKPTVIEPDDKRVLASRRTGEVFGVRVQHPGTRPRPFFRPALDEGQEPATARMAHALRRALEALTARARRA